MPEIWLLPGRRWSRRQHDTGQPESILFPVGLGPELVLERVPEPELVLGPAQERVLVLELVLEPAQALVLGPVWHRRQQ